MKKCTIMDKNLRKEIIYMIFYLILLLPFSILILNKLLESQFDGQLNLCSISKAFHILFITLNYEKL